MPISEPASTSRPLTHPPPVSRVVGDHEAGRDSARPGPALLLRAAASIDGRPELLAGTPVTPPPSDPLPRHPPMGSGDYQSPVRVGVATTAASGGPFQAPVDGPHALAGAPQASGLQSGLPSTTSGTLAHSLEWQYKAVPQPIGGPVPRRPWSVRTQGGDIISEGSMYVGFGLNSRSPRLLPRRLPTSAAVVNDVADVRQASRAGASFYITRRDSKVLWRAHPCHAR